MANDEEDRPEEPSPHAQLVQKSTAHMQSRVLYVAAELRLADHLADGPKRAEDLAEPTGTHAPTLHRVMCALAHYGVLSMEDGGRFSLTSMGEALQSDAPGATRSAVLNAAGDAYWNAFLKLPETLEDGESGFEKAHGRSYFEYLGDHPEEASRFNDAMIGLLGPEHAAVVDAYDFSGFDTIVDIGGGTGHLLATILERYPGPEGVLFDLPRVIEEAPPLLEERGIADRVTCVDGDFFEAVPAGGDAYLLSETLHDWADERCLTILRNCRRAIKPSGTLLITEWVLPEEGPPHPGYESDIAMLALTGGRERTRSEYATLLEEAGFRLKQVIPTDSPADVVEAAPAGP